MIWCTRHLSPPHPDRNLATRPPPPFPSPCTRKRQPQQYLVNKFDVPDFLVPSLTDLVALLVFRQARSLVFGYDRRRVMERDLAWREKASGVATEKKLATRPR